MPRQKRSRGLPPSKFGGIDVDIIAGEVNLYKYNNPGKQVDFWTIHSNLCAENDAFKKSGVTQDELESFYNKYHVPEWDEMWAVKRIQDLAVHGKMLKALVDWKGFPASDPRSEENWLPLDGLHPRYIDDYCKRNAASGITLIKAMEQLSRSAALLAWKSIKETNAGKEMAQSGKYIIINSLIDSSASSQVLHEPKPKRQGGQSREQSMEPTPDVNQASLHVTDLTTVTKTVSISKSTSLAPRESSEGDTDDIHDTDEGIESISKCSEDQKAKQSYNPVVTAIDKALTGAYKVGSNKLPIEMDLSNRLREVLTIIEAKACRISIKQSSKASPEGLSEASILFTHLMNDGTVKKRTVALSLDEVAADHDVAVYVLKEFIKKSTIK
ncbi:Hypothetical protein GLP15_4211 [Giardia lamblia P15]|uniref:Chromo domain-containing protein n=1 Tax=Giardia intestinalis (strain P15) TaxID=658858 RepID=E1F0R2_GIAIA|nr:Hypothetical protein GLP15_4211 [Giardia lamblia P15]